MTVVEQVASDFGSLAKFLGRVLDRTRGSDGKYVYCVLTAPVWRASLRVCALLIRSARFGVGEVSGQASCEALGAGRGVSAESAS